MTDDTPTDDNPHAAEQAAPLDAAPNPAAPLDEELAALKDRHLRLAADFDNFRRRAVKERGEIWEKAQADLVMALHLRGDAFTLDEKIADFAYYEARTVRDSSLSAAQQAVVAAETGHLQLAHDYWGEAALTDLQNLHHNSGHGLHIASLAGGLASAWPAGRRQPLRWRCSCRRGRSFPPLPKCFVGSSRQSPACRRPWRA